MDMRGDSTPDDAANDAEVGTWMTYDELAAARGIDRISAVKLALRNVWRKQRDKYRVARVHVPPEWAVVKQGQGVGGGVHGGANTFLGDGAFAADEQERRATEAPPKQSEQTRAVERSMWQKLLADERERADKAEQERARLLSVIDGFESRINAAEARAHEADEALAAEHARAARAVEALAAEPARTSQPDEALAAQRTRAEQAAGEALAAARALAELTDRTLAAERARADQAIEALVAERARADQANEARDTERARADRAVEALAAERARADQANEALDAERARADQANAALDAERARADQANEALDAERARADRMRDWLDEVRGFLARGPVGAGEQEAMLPDGE